MDTKSILGYSRNSPYRNDPFIDIFTPGGLIDMSQTDIDLIGIDNRGNKKKMKANSKNPYKFEGNVVREIPLSKQVGGSIPNAGYKGMIDELTIEDALMSSPNLKFRKDGKFKGLIPMEDWNDDVMNYIDKFKIIKKKGEKFVKVRGKLDIQSSNPYIDPSTLPAPSLKMGGNPYKQMGGINQIFQEIFGEEDDEMEEDILPVEEVIEEKDILTHEKAEMAMYERMQEEMAMIEGTRGFDSPSRRSHMDEEWEIDAEQPETYTRALSSGKWGNENIGQHGKKIVSDITAALGYQPTFNSIFRDRKQQDALIKSGAPAAKNSYHLTGDAVDMKPADWNRLTPEKQQYFRKNYDVIYHNNHYHIEPK